MLNIKIWCEEQENNPPHTAESRCMQTVPAFLGRGEVGKLHLRLLQGTGSPVAEVERHACFQRALVQSILWLAQRPLMSPILTKRWGERSFSAVCLSVVFLACAVHSDCVSRTWCLLYAAG